MYNNKAKLKTLYVRQILEQETDEEHGLSMRQIIERLADYDIQAERKSVYRDIEVLREYGCDIRSYQRNPMEYALIRRQFRLPELMLMVDAVESSRALTERQCEMLVTNIKLLASDYEREKLDRRIHVPGRIRTKDECVFGNIDAVHEAIRLDRKVRFPYFRRGVDGERIPTRGGRPHVVTPMEVVYCDEHYYLTAWDDGHECTVRYRFDRMGRARVLEEEASKDEGIARHAFDSKRYESFGMFGGEEVLATLEADADKAEILIDRFGDGMELAPSDEEKVRVRVRIHKSEQFYGWVAGLGNRVRIAGPESLVDDYRNYLKTLLEG